MSAGSHPTPAAPPRGEWDEFASSLQAPLIGSDFTEGASEEPATCGCGEPITLYGGVWLHIINPELRGTDDHDAEPS